MRGLENLQEGELGKFSPYQTNAMGVEPDKTYMIVHKIFHWRRCSMKSSSGRTIAKPS